MVYRQLPFRQPFHSLLSPPPPPRGPFYLRRDFVATTINCFKARLDWERLISLAPRLLFRPFAPASNSLIPPAFGIEQFRERLEGARCHNSDRAESGSRATYMPESIERAVRDRAG